jgi:hypothetical protein
MNVSALSDYLQATNLLVGPTPAYEKLLFDKVGPPDSTTPPRFLFVRDTSTGDIYGNSTRTGAVRPDSSVWFLVISGDLLGAGESVLTATPGTP